MTVQQPQGLVPVPAGDVSVPTGEDGPIRVVVVDDDDTVRTALVMLLDHHGGFRVVAQATDGAYAPSLVGTLRPDLVVIDVRMPLVGGIDALELIRQVDREVRIVMLSAYSDDALVADALAAGASGYLVKGCSAEELFATLEQARRDAPPARSEQHD
jgi:DNA-binding NarL/FixJ family response regulator